MKIHCRCDETKFEVDVDPRYLSETKLICTKCHRDFLTDFGPRIFEIVLKNLYRKLLGRK